MGATEEIMARMTTAARLNGIPGQDDIDEAGSFETALSSASKAYVDGKHADLTKKFDDILDLLKKGPGQRKPRSKTTCKFCKDILPYNRCKHPNDEKKCRCSKKFEGERPAWLQAKMDAAGNS